MLFMVVIVFAASKVNALQHDSIKYNLQWVNEVVGLFYILITCMCSLSCKDLEGLSKARYSAHYFTEAKTEAQGLSEIPELRFPVET